MSKSLPFEITVLGNGASQPMAGKYHSSQVVNIHGHRYLLDCGEGTQKAMLECGINPLKLKAIFITHMHGDHMYGIFPLVDTLGQAQRQEPLMIFAPAPLIRLMQGMKQCPQCWESYGMECHEIDTTAHQIIYETSFLEVWTVPLTHTVPTAGYLFKEKRPGLNVRKDMIRRYDLDIAQILAAKEGEDVEVQVDQMPQEELLEVIAPTAPVIAAPEGGGVINDDSEPTEGEPFESGPAFIPAVDNLRNLKPIAPDDTVTVPNSRLTYVPFCPRSYAYCTDGVYDTRTAEMVDGVDILYHEATFSDDDRETAHRNGHSTSVEAAEIARKARAQKLLVGHISARYPDEERIVEEAREVFPDTEQAKQGWVYTI